VLWGVVCLRLGSSSGGNLTEFLYLQHLQQATGGDASAVEVVVQKLQSRIAGMAAHYARCSGEDADDLRQEAWLGLLEALPNLDLHIGDPEQYLVRYARWRLLDAVRRARLRRCDSLNNWLESAQGDDFAQETMLNRFGLCFTTNCGRVDMAENTVEAISLAEFCSQLQVTQRVVLNCLMRGLTWRETASVLGCTSANVAYHVRQIRCQYQTWSDGATLPAAG
jgi:RNA polymerase sigma-70 factor (ECF subfamily)